MLSNWRCAAVGAFHVALRRTRVLQIPGCDLLYQRSIIAVELTNSSVTKNYMVFQPTSEQAKYGASGILKRNGKAFAVFL